MKVGSKRRKTKAQLEAESLQEKVKMQVNENAMQAVEELQQRIRQLEAENNNNRAAIQILQGMIDRGEAEVEEDGSVSLALGIGGRQSAMQSEMLE